MRLSLGVSQITIYMITDSDAVSQYMITESDAVGPHSVTARGAHLFGCLLNIPHTPRLIEQGSHGGTCEVAACLT